MRNFLIGIFFTIVSIVILFASIYGVLTPKETIMSSVGTLQIAAFENGLSFFQNFRGQFFNISPFNDYLIFKDGSRNAIISRDQIIAKQYTSTFYTSKWQQIIDTIRGYFNTVHPTYTLISPIKTTYTTSIDKNTVTIRKTIDSPMLYDSSIMGTTLTYRDNSFIFDEERNLYVPHSAQEIAQIEKIYGIKLTSQTESGELRFEIPSRTLYILNPSITGLLVVQAKENQRLFVNRNYNIIEVEESIQLNSNTATTEIALEVIEYTF